MSLVSKAVRPYRKIKEVQFTSDPRVFNLMWDVRRGIIPSAGAMRPVSTSVILEGTRHSLETTPLTLCWPSLSFVAPHLTRYCARLSDVAVEVPRLASMTMDLQDMFKRHRYDDAVIFGHALDGTLLPSSLSAIGRASGRDEGLNKQQH
jgi:D-lactate dehydrogenase